jgi:hypothetical protein
MERACVRPSQASEISLPALFSRWPASIFCKAPLKESTSKVSSAMTRFNRFDLSSQP